LLSYAARRENCFCFWNWAVILTKTFLPTDASRADFGPLGAQGSWPGSAHAPVVHLRFADGRSTLSGTASARMGHRPGTPDASLGLYAAWTWDGATLTAEVDTLGYFSLFVYQRDSDIALSPSILQLLALGADPEPDPVALAVFHRIGHFLGEDTPFRHIKVLPPGGRLVWQNGAAKITGTVPIPREQALTRAQAVEAFIELPRSALRRFLADWDGPMILPLSGGRDSRHILLELAHQGRKPDMTVTFHQGGRHLDREGQAARALSERAGVRHTILGHARRRLRDAVRAVLLTQLCADEHAQMMPMHDFLHGHPGAAALDGIGGDILTNPDDSAADFFGRARQGDYDGIARRLTAGHGSVISRHGNAGGAGAIYSRDLEEAAIARIAAAIRAFDGAPDPYQAYWFWNRTRREIAFVSTGILGPAARVACPFLSPEFVELGLSLPFAVTRDQKLHDDAIAKAYPDFADIPYQSGFQTPRMPRFRWSKVVNALDALHVSAMVRAGGSVLSDVKHAIKNSPLHRGPANVYRLHAGFVAAMDAQEAQRLIAVEARLDRAALKGQRVVSDVFPAA
jgi:asparagine synthase (glutamine-hydrolysing)